MAKDAVVAKGTKALAAQPERLSAKAQELIAKYGKRFSRVG